MGASCAPMARTSCAHRWRQRRRRQQHSSWLLRETDAFRLAPNPEQRSWSRSPTPAGKHTSSPTRALRLLSASFAWTSQTTTMTTGGSWSAAASTFIGNAWARPSTRTSAARTAGPRGAAQPQGAYLTLAACALPLQLGRQPQALARVDPRGIPHGTHRRMRPPQTQSLRQEHRPRYPRRTQPPHQVQPPRRLRCRGQPHRRGQSSVRRLERCTRRVRSRRGPGCFGVEVRRHRTMPRVTAPAAHAPCRGVTSSMGGPQ